jgi:hypothetical protein
VSWRSRIWQGPRPAVSERSSLRGQDTYRLFEIQRSAACVPLRAWGFSGAGVLNLGYEPIGSRDSLEIELPAVQKRTYEVDLDRPTLGIPVDRLDDDAAFVVRAVVRISGPAR